MQVTPSSPQTQSPQFSSNFDPAKLVTRAASMMPNAMQKGASKFLGMKEGTGGNMHFQFFQDTAILWAPKAVVCRTPLELFEITFVELAESGFFYYFSPLVAAPLLCKLFQKMGPKALKADPSMLAKPLSAIEKASWSKVMPSKAGLALASVGVGTFSQYALNFVKNIITERKFKKNEFSDIIGLTKGEVQKTKKESQVMKKAKRRIAQCIALMTGITIASLLAARHAHRVPALAKSMDKIGKWLDFNFNAVPGKPGKYKFDLGGNQLKLLMPFAIFSYADAARDKLERVEAGCRAFVTGTYIAYWQPLIAGWWNRKVGQNYAHLNIFKNKMPKPPQNFGEFATDALKLLTGQRNYDLKTREEIMKDCILLAEQKLKEAGHAVNKAAVEKKALELYQPRFVAKAKLFAGPFFFGILGVGLFTAAMNRIWTSYRFHLSQVAMQKSKHHHHNQQHKPHVPSVPVAVDSNDAVVSINPPRFNDVNSSVITPSQYAIQQPATHSGQVVFHQGYSYNPRNYLSNPQG